MKLSILSCVFLGLSANYSKAEIVYSRAVVPQTGTPAAMDNPPCSPDDQAKNLGQQIAQKGGELVGKATSSLGLGSDPFNTRRLNQAVCMDLCVVIPSGANFKARGSITPIDWTGDLPSGLPGTVNPGIFAAIQGPAVSSGSKGDVVCYTAKNWSHNQARNVGVEITY